MEAYNFPGGAGGRTFKLWSYIVFILADSSIIITRDAKGAVERTKTKPKTEKPRMRKLESWVEIPAAAMVVPISCME